MNEQQQQLIYDLPSLIESKNQALTSTTTKSNNDNYRDEYRWPPLLLSMREQQSAPSPPPIKSPQDSTTSTSKTDCLFAAIVNSPLSRAATAYKQHLQKSSIYII
ncbi:hypothetical protein DERP_005245 [Dermatophagoides pteronyssinus]|uniref:Uncharacterized protein n=1 Tax=Dermatophagoides pteronyssinus TaxID=6956 RepID=A0ABQ8JM21_DERPT|nr:hypothetical protein DERP_005245 [Dermatophagoides pteronyssinus]